MTTDTLMTEAPQTTEGAAASTQATQEGATAAPVDGQQTAAPEQAAAAPAQQQPEQPQVPESYEFTAPEGVQLLDGAKEAYAEIAKELKLTSEQAQSAFEKLVIKGQANQLKQAEVFYQDIGGTPDKWAEQLRSHQEFGGDKLKETLPMAKKAIEQFFPARFVSVIDKLKIGDHPDFFEGMVRIGQAISSDQNLVTGRQAPAQASDARSHYPASNMNP
jgi:hypothetical protein